MTKKENGRLVMEDAAAIAGKTRTEIDLKDRVIRRTWKLLGLTRSRTYELDSHVSVQIRENSTMLEGYTIASFDVYLSVGGGKMRISSADDLREARLIRDGISGFLKEAAVKRPPWAG